MQPIVKLVIAGTAMFATLGLIAGLSGMYSLNIKAKTVGHGSTAPPGGPPRGKSKRRTPMCGSSQNWWRKGEHLPTEQGHRGGMPDPNVTALATASGLYGTSWW